MNFFFLSNNLMVRVHTIKCGEVSVWSSDLKPCINYAMSLQIELNLRGLNDISLTTTST